MRSRIFQGLKEPACTTWYVTSENADCKSFAAIRQTLHYLNTKLEASTHHLKTVYFKSAETQLVQTVDLNGVENWLTQLQIEM